MFYRHNPDEELRSAERDYMETRSKEDLQRWLHIAARSHTHGQVLQNLVRQYQNAYSLDELSYDNKLLRGTAYQIRKTLSQMGMFLENYGYDQYKLNYYNTPSATVRYLVPPPEDAPLEEKQRFVCLAAHLISAFTHCYKIANSMRLIFRGAMNHEAHNTEVYLREALPYATIEVDAHNEPWDGAMSWRDPQTIHINVIRVSFDKPSSARRNPDENVRRLERHYIDCSPRLKPGDS